MPLLSFFIGFALNDAADDKTFRVCTLAIGIFTFMTAIEMNAEPRAYALGAFFVVLIKIYSIKKPAILNDCNLPVWLLFLPHLRNLCAMVPVDGRWSTDAMRDMFHARLA